MKGKLTVGDVMSEQFKQMSEGVDAICKQYETKGATHRWRGAIPITHPRKPNTLLYIIQHMPHK